VRKPINTAATVYSPWLGIMENNLAWIHGCGTESVVIQLASWQSFTMSHSVLDIGRTPQVQEKTRMFKSTFASCA
jgi:hypothetical protein